MESCFLLLLGLIRFGMTFLQQAELCRNEGCTTRIHLYCLKKKFSQRRVSLDVLLFYKMDQTLFYKLHQFTDLNELQVERVCPGCGTQWQHSSITDAAIEEEDEPNRPSQKRQPPPPAAAATRKRLRSCKIEDEENNVASSSQTSVPVSSTDFRRITRKSARLR